MKSKTIRIEYKGVHYSFSTSYSFREIQRIIYEYPYPSEIPDKVNWWYRKTDFGEYFLDMVNLSIVSIQKVGIRGCDWKLFRPVFREYFPTITENRRLSLNLQFLLGGLASPVHDYYFAKYVTLLNFGKLNNEEIDNMNHKDALMLYKYVIGQLVTRNVMVNLAKDNIIKKEEQKDKKRDGMIS